MSTSDEEIDRLLKEQARILKEKQAEEDAAYVRQQEIDKLNERVNRNEG